MKSGDTVYIKDERGKEWEVKIDKIKADTTFGPSIVGEFREVKPP